MIYQNDKQFPVLCSLTPCTQRTHSCYFKTEASSASTVHCMHIDNDRAVQCKIIINTNSRNHAFLDVSYRFVFKFYSFYQSFRLSMETLDQSTCTVQCTRSQNELTVNLIEKDRKKTTKNKNPTTTWQKGKIKEAQ